MPSNEALGTITWVPVSEEWGRGVLNQPWGGAPFTDCPGKGQTRFFLGRYGTGGKLIACTVGADGRRLHGRYDGQGGEFRPGSFDVSIVTDPADSEQEFEGVYVEDGGITTDWCGELIASTRPDVLAPHVSALPRVLDLGHLEVMSSGERKQRGIGCSSCLARLQSLEMRRSVRMAGRGLGQMDPMVHV